MRRCSTPPGRLVVGSNLPVFGDVVGPGRRALSARDHAPGRHLLVQRLLRLQGRRLALARPGVPGAGVRRRASLSAFAQSWAHFNDIGGMRPGSLSPDCTDIYQEGIIVPPVRVAREGVIVEELLRLFYRNSRFPEMVKGDTRASMAAIRLGERRLGELFERFGRGKDDRRLRPADRGDRARAAQQAARAGARGQPRLHRHRRQRRPGPRPHQAALSPRRGARPHHARHQRQRRPGAGAGQLPDEPARAGHDVRLLSAGRGLAEHPQRRRRDA